MPINKESVTGFRFFKWIILGAIVVGAAGWWGGQELIKRKQEKEIEKTVTGFLSLAANKENEKAYFDYASAGFKNNTTVDGFKGAMKKFKAQYSGFARLESEVVEWKTGGKEADYKGRVFYDNTDKGRVTASLVKENNKWKIYIISVHINPDRLKRFE